MEISNPESIFQNEDYRALDRKQVHVSKKLFPMNAPDNFYKNIP